MITVTTEPTAVESPPIVPQELHRRVNRHARYFLEVIGPGNGENEVVVVEYTLATLIPSCISQVQVWLLEP